MSTSSTGMLDRLRAQGFAESTFTPRPYEPSWRPRCSCCEVLVICGVATHETGCPNAAAARRRALDEDGS